MSDMQGGALATSTGGAISPMKVKERSVMQLIKQVDKTTENLLPPGYSTRRLAALMLTAFRDTPKLLQCSEGSILRCLYACAKLGLEPNTPQGHAYLIPYGKEATFVLGYQGASQLARRGGVRKIWSRCVYANERFEVRYGTDDTVEHIPILSSKDRGEKVAVYACAVLDSGETQFEVLTPEEVAERRAVSKSASRSDSPWNKWEDRMWQKTAIRQLCKRLSLPDVAAQAMADDDRGEMGEAPVHTVSELDELGELGESGDVKKAEGEGEWNDPGPPPGEGF